jgi:hypothetical protein
MNPEYSKTIFLISKEPESWPDEFAIITAHNPMDLKLSDYENSLRNEKLLKRIQSNVFLELSGSSPDHSHQEASFAFTSKIQEAVDIGKEFQQKAIYYVKDGNLKLVECCTRKIEELGNFNDRFSLDQYN